MTVLLHTCCGPCASACVPRLKGLGHEVTMLFANSNIDTREEYEKRLREAEKLAKVDGVKIVALPYDHEEWLREVATGYEAEPEKGARCARCFRYNLAKTAEYAAAHGYASYTTSLTVSPHKVSAMIFEAGRGLSGEGRASARPCDEEAGLTREGRAFARPCDEGRRTRGSASLPPAFLDVDFKKKEGFKLSVRRAEELGLYRQAYCGCEFSKTFPWTIHHKAETASTNLDARAGMHGDVFTADFQTAGRGRLDHKWLSPPGTNLMMSAVFSVEGIVPEQVATLPLVAGLAVAKAVLQMLVGNRDVRRKTQDVKLKWPNDVLVDGKKIAGILCERNGDNVIVGIGVNVGQTEFDTEIADRATSLRVVLGAPGGRALPSPDTVRDRILSQIDRWYGVWRTQGFAAVHREIAALDFLRGRTISVRQTDGDSAPISGVSNGIMNDGSLDVGGTRVYAGEAHVESL